MSGHRRSADGGSLFFAIVVALVSKYFWVLLIVAVIIVLVLLCRRAAREEDASDPSDLPPILASPPSTSYFDYKSIARSVGIEFSEISFSALKKRIAETGFVALDFETTGLHPEEGDRIIEVAAIYYDSACRQTASYTTLVYPDRLIPWEASEKNHITNAMVARKPMAATVMPQMLEFLSRFNAPLVAHNAKFDIGFLEAELARLRIPFRAEYADTLAYSRRTFSGLSNHKLGTVCRHVGHTIQSQHRAFGDAQGVAAIVRNACDS